MLVNAAIVRFAVLCQNWRRRVVVGNASELSACRSGCAVYICSRSARGKRIHIEESQTYRRHGRNWNIRPEYAQPGLTVTSTDRADRLKIRKVTELLLSIWTYNQSLFAICWDCV